MKKSRDIHSFHGGVHLPERKRQSTRQPIRFAGIPERLCLPLQQHIGSPGRPIVAVGDRVLKGQRIAESSSQMSVPLHAPTSGVICAIANYPVPHPSGLSGPCIVIEPDGHDRWTTLQPLRDYQGSPTVNLVYQIRQCGIAGMGGAGFPTSVKLRPRVARGIDTLIINGAECEPYITADDMLMRERAGQVIEGAKIMAHLLKPETCMIGVEDNKPEAVQALRTAARGSFIDVVAIPTRYPAGGEKLLIKVLTGREVPSGGIPANIGVICQNVSTTAAIYRAVHFGEPLISRITTITGGGVQRPRNLEVLFGTPISHLLGQCGFVARKTSRLVMGGPMMGFVLPDASLPVVKTSNCIIAVAPDEWPAPAPERACIRCGRCAEVCPAELLPQQLYWFARAGELDKAEEANLFDCIECGACAYVCPSHIPLVQYYRSAKGQVRQHRKAIATAEVS